MGTIKVGMSASLTGQFRVQGKQALAGLRAWADDVNRSGGLVIDRRDSGWPIAVVHHDDQSQPDCVRQVTSRLIKQDAVDLLFGPYSSVLSMAAAEVAEEHQRVFWNQGGASDNIYQQGFAWTVGVLTPASGYLEGFLPLVRQVAPSAARVGIIRAYPGAFPQAVTSTVHRQAKALGFRVNYLHEYSPSITDFSSVLEEVKGARLDVLVAVGRIGNDIQLAHQMAATRTGIKAVAVVATPIQQFWDALGEGAQGFIGPSQWEQSVHLPSDYGPSTASVMASLRNHSVSQNFGQNSGQHPGPIDYPMAQAYAAGLVAQASVERASSLENRELRHRAGEMDISTFYGRFKIEPNTGKQIGRSTLLVQWQKGEKVVLWPPEQAKGQLVYPWPKG